jgi:hypothetical protein
VDLYFYIKTDNSSIFWGATEASEPILNMNDQKTNCSINAFTAGEMVGLKKHGSQLLADGFIGRVVLYDNQQKLSSPVIEKIDIKNDNPYAIIKNVVLPYPGANPKPNLLMDLECFRKYTLLDSKINVQVTFKNPTKKEMKFGFRINNLLMPGSRFEKCNRTVEFGSTKIDNNDPVNNIFIKSGSQVDFMKNQQVISWDGSEIVVRAQNDGLVENAFIIPGKEFAGIYCWKGRNKITTELLSPMITLKPQDKIVFSYYVK